MRACTRPPSPRRPPRPRASTPRGSTCATSSTARSAPGPAPAPMSSRRCAGIATASWSAPSSAGCRSSTTTEALAALAAARRAWDQGRGAWPTHARRRTHRVHGEAARRHGRGARGGRAAPHVGDRQARARTPRSEFDRTVAYIRRHHRGAEGPRPRRRRASTSRRARSARSRRAPLGVVLCMGPFNYPLNETFTTLIPALIMGNTIVCKLPKYGGLCQIPLLEAFRDAFPRGVVNVVQGDGATVIGPIMASGDVDCLAFIGSSRVANMLARQHPRPNRLRTRHRARGQEPRRRTARRRPRRRREGVRRGRALVQRPALHRASSSSSLHESVADPFLERLAAAVGKLRAGMPWDEGVDLTPLPEDGKPAWLAALVEDAVSRGAPRREPRRRRGARHLRATGGRATPSIPRCASTTRSSSGRSCRSPSGATSDEIDDFMRESPYGQQVSLFGRDPRRIAQLVDVMANQVCRINVNTQCRRGPDSLPVHRPQGLRRGHALDPRRAARLLHPDRLRHRHLGAEQGPCDIHRFGQYVGLPQHRFHPMKRLSFLWVAETPAAR